MIKICFILHSFIAYEEPSEAFSQYVKYLLAAVSHAYFLKKVLISSFVLLLIHYVYCHAEEKCHRLEYCLPVFYNNHFVYPIVN